MTPAADSPTILIVDDIRQRLGAPFLFGERGIIEAKGIGALHTWFLAGRGSTLSE